MRERVSVSGGGGALPRAPSRGRVTRRVNYGYTAQDYLGLLRAKGLAHSDFSARDDNGYLMRYVDTEGEPAFHEDLEPVEVDAYVIQITGTGRKARPSGSPSDLPYEGFHGFMEKTQYGHFHINHALHFKSTQLQCRCLPGSGYANRKVQDTRWAIADIVPALKEGRESELCARNALNATELIFACWESARRRGRVDLPLMISDNPLEAMVESGELSPARAGGNEECIHGGMPSPGLIR